MNLKLGASELAVSIVNWFCVCVSICLPRWTSSCFVYLFCLRGRPFSLPPLFANRPVRLQPFPERRVAFLPSSQSSSSFLKSWKPCRLKVYHPRTHPSEQPSFQPWRQSRGLQEFPAESASGPRAAGLTRQWWHPHSSHSSTWGRLSSTGRPGAAGWGQCWHDSRQLFQPSMCGAPASASLARGMPLSTWL